MLDDTGKMLERVVASRVVKHIEGMGPNLSNEQFGFRAGRSTIDALTVLKRLSTEVTSKGGRLLAVSIDIANAFNSLSYEVIQDALEHFQMPLVSSPPGREGIHKLVSPG